MSRYAAAGNAGAACKRPGLACFLMAVAAAQDSGPLPYTRKSIARGKQFYLISCVECHDQDGKGLGGRDFNGTPPSDLTNPDVFLHGMSAEAIFASIREGTKEGLPPFTRMECPAR